MGQSFGGVAQIGLFVGGSWAANSFRSDTSATDTAQAETTRHNLATEESQKQRELWTQRQARRKDWEVKAWQVKKQAIATTQDADETLGLWIRAHPPSPPVGAEPMWQDYHKPSKSQKSIELAVMGVGALGSAYLVSKVL